MPRTIITPPNAPVAIGIYTSAVKVGNAVCLSAQIPLDPVTMRLVVGVENQITRVLETSPPCRRCEFAEVKDRRCNELRAHE